MDCELLKVKDLEIIYKTYDNTVRAVNKISFTIKKGKTLGLVGETGAGKTTTALSLIRLLPDKSAKILGGEILFNGKDILKMSNEEIRNKIRGESISMIFQDPMSALNPVMSIGKQIAESIYYHNSGISDEDLNKRIDTVLEMVGIPSSRKHEYPHQFSGGMKQRVVIAIALSCEPQLLIADEPTTALDVTIQAQVLSMMRDLNEKYNTSMLLITHDLGVVAQSCDDVAVMYAGEIIEIGTLKDIFTNEKHHPYTVGLFGAIPNLIGETRRLSPIAGTMPDPSNLPKGCFFQERCPYCMDICKTTAAAVYKNGTHEIACHKCAMEGGE